MTATEKVGTAGDLHPGDELRAEGALVYTVLTVERNPATDMVTALVRYTIDGGNAYRTWLAKDVVPHVRPS